MKFTCGDQRMRLILRWILGWSCLFMAALIFGTDIGRKDPKDSLPAEWTKRILENASSACELPRLDPFDPSILKYVKLPTEPLDCTEKYGRPILFSTSHDHGPHLVRLEDPSKYRLTKCCYQPFSAVGGDQDGVKLSTTCYQIGGKMTRISPEHEFIIVYCHKHDGDGTNLEMIDMFAFVHEKSHRFPTPTTNNSTKTQFNIALIGIDTISAMNLIRTMPSTVKYLRNVSAIEMRGYTKVGDSTLPNLMALLTGLGSKETEGVDGGCLGRGEKHYVDNCPFIWNNFSQAGYVTSYAEDGYWISTFHNAKSGFRVPPTDYYLRQFMVKLELELSHYGTGNIQVCFGPRTGFRLFLDYVESLAVTMARTRVGLGNRKYFSLTWSNSLSHDYLNVPYHGDVDLANLLQRFKADPDLEDTILVLLSDHGMRSGPIRSTTQGQIEERMPFLYFLFPETFKVKYKAAIQNLKVNSERLTTPFDLHETLLDLVNPDKSISNEALQNHRHSKSNLKVHPRGISLFTPVPINRTCADASIAEHWCVCHSTRKWTVSDPGRNALVKSALQVIMTQLNGMLANHSECARLELVAILSAQAMAQVQHAFLAVGISEKEDAVSQLTVTFDVAPSKARFEATVTRVWEKPTTLTWWWEWFGEIGDWGSWILSGEPSRLNRYGNQSHCVHEYKLKKYCFCVQ